MYIVHHNNQISLNNEKGPIELRDIKKEKKKKK